LASRLQSETIAAVSGDSVRIAVPSGYFASHSQVKIDIHSDPYSFGQLEVDEAGSLMTVLELPNHIPDGYHTVYVTGTSLLGESITLYDVVSVGQATLEQPSDPLVSISQIGAEGPLPKQAATEAKEVDPPASSEVVALQAEYPKGSREPSNSIQQVKGMADDAPSLRSQARLGEYLPKIIIGAGAVMMGVFVTVMLLRRRF
ncbi:MAG TPA: hypothetical protein PLY16_00590, partial [Candidatus Saccharibacteria bacterium]|nr:hypothetical protein [Candidatus Saccharibacteria bacterium]